MTSFTDANLLYRATRDGFSAKAFHQKCDNYHNTLTIIKTNGNYVFGGYTSALWNEVPSGWINDPTAFIFSLRRNGVFNDQKFVISSNTWQNDYAIFGSSGSGPTFGGGFDIHICDNSNIASCSSSYFCITFVCPGECINSSDSWNCGRSYLAGSYDGWLTTEIEVFQLTNSVYTLSASSVTTKVMTNNFNTFPTHQTTIESKFLFYFIFLS